MCVSYLSLALSLSLPLFSQAATQCTLTPGARLELDGEPIEVDGLKLDCEPVEEEVPLFLGSFGADLELSEVHIWAVVREVPVQDQGLAIFVMLYYNCFLVELKSNLDAG